MPTGLRFGRLGDGWLHVCVDMQQLFGCGGPWEMDWFEEILFRLVPLVEHTPARSAFTRFIPAQSMEEAPGAWRRYYAAWPDITRERLPPEFLNLARPLRRFVPPGIVLDKHVYSPWVEGNLERLISANRVDTLVISGGETDMCVLSTVLGAVDRGLRVVLAGDGMCSSQNATHDAVLNLYEQRFSQQIEVASVQEILEAL